MHWDFIAVLGLSLIAVRGASTLVAVLGLLIVVASLVEHRLYSAGSVDTAHGLSCPVARGILVSDQGSNPCPLLWQADSQPPVTREVPMTIKLLTALLNRGHYECLLGNKVVIRQSQAGDRVQVGLSSDLRSTIY